MNNEQNDVREDDVEKLAANLANPNVDKTENWKEGYLYAKENTYTEEQVREAIMWGINNGRKGGCSIYDINEYIESLQQQQFSRLYIFPCN